LQEDLLSSALTEKWDGTSWTEVNDLNTARRYLGSAGTQNLALGFGGENPRSIYTANTEIFDGTSWTEINDLSTARTGLAGGGSSVSAYAASGYNIVNLADTEEFTAAPISIKTFTTS
jgi:hypothetical protein